MMNSKLFYVIAIILSWNSYGFATDNRDEQIALENKFSAALHEFATIARYDSLAEARNNLTQSHSDRKDQLPKIIFAEGAFYLLRINNQKPVFTKIAKGRFLDGNNEKFDLFCEEYFHKIIPIFYEKFLSMHKVNASVARSIVRNYFLHKSDVNHYLIDFFCHVFSSTKEKNWFYDSTYEDEFYYFLSFSVFDEAVHNYVISKTKKRHNKNAFSEFNVEYLLKTLITNRFRDGVTAAFNNISLLFSALAEKANAHHAVANQIASIEELVDDDWGKLQLFVALQKSIKTWNSDDLVLKSVAEKIKSLLSTVWISSPEKVQLLVRREDHSLETLFADILKKVNLNELTRYVAVDEQFGKRSSYSHADVVVLERLLVAGYITDAEGLLDRRELYAVELQDAQSFFSFIDDREKFLKSVAQFPNSDVLQTIREFFHSFYKGSPETFSDLEMQGTFSALQSAYLNNRFLNTYKNDFTKIHTMRFNSYRGEDIKVDPSTFVDVPLMIIYNNDDFSKDEHNEFFKGNKIAYDKDTPIGYNVYLPQLGHNEKIQEVLFVIYGGNSPVKEKIKYLTRPPTRLVYKRLLQENVAIIELNLVDLLFDFHQVSTPEFLHDKIHQSIDHMFTILTTQPQQIHVNLADALSPELRVFLFGSSFGGGVSFRHAQMKPKTFSGYLSHGGQFFKNKANYYLGIYLDDRETTWLDVASPSHFRTLEDRLLILQNSDDNCVPEEVAYFCYRQAAKQSKEHLIRLHVTPMSNDIPQKLLYKGHYTTDHPLLLARYIDQIVDFIKNDNHDVHTAFSAWTAYENKTRAYKRNADYIDAAHLFAGHALDLHIEHAHRYNDVLNNEIWQQYYAPIQKIIAYVDRLKSNSVLGKQEAARLENQLNNDNLRRVFHHYLPIITDYLRFTIRAERQDVDEALVRNESRFLQILKEKILLYLRNDLEDSERFPYMESILFHLYKHDNDLFLTSFEEASRSDDFDDDMNKIKEYFLKVLNQRKKHIDRCVDDLVNLQVKQPQ